MTSTDNEMVHNMLRKEQQGIAEAIYQISDIIIADM